MKFRLHLIFFCSLWVIISDRNCYYCIYKPLDSTILRTHSNTQTYTALCPDTHANAHNSLHINTHFYTQTHIFTPKHTILHPYKHLYTQTHILAAKHASTHPLKHTAAYQRSGASSSPSQTVSDVTQFSRPWFNLAVLRL